MRILLVDSGAAVLQATTARYHDLGICLVPSLSSIRHNLHYHNHPHHVKQQYTTIVNSYYPNPIQSSSDRKMTLISSSPSSFMLNCYLYSAITLRFTYEESPPGAASSRTTSHVFPGLHRRSWPPFVWRAHIY